MAINMQFMGFKRTRGKLFLLGLLLKMLWFMVTNFWTITRDVFWYLRNRWNRPS